MKSILYFFLVISLLSCKTDKKQMDTSNPEGDTLAIKYAKGFSITQFDGYKILNVKNAWPDSDKDYTYLLVIDENKVPENLNYDSKISIPVKKIVVTSTTHIPSLEALNEEKSLVGFPGLQYISSKKTRTRIEKNELTELGTNEAINTEIVLALKPDVLIGFSIEGNNKTYDTFKKSGIPVVFNGDWMEESPLGKAEWIKFFGAFYNKTEMASLLFKKIDIGYKKAKKLAATAESSPQVLSGSMYKDQWYVPYGNSWQAQFIKDANASYIYSDTHGNGSIALAFETVLSDAQHAEFWVAPGQFTSFSQLDDASLHYKQFTAVKNKKVYTYSNSLGETGGVLYYELGPNRPDLVLKDLIAIFHPELLPDYKTTFFKPLE
ncbi:ABC transporter substrate-binding protein [Gillisia sp. M10.2A]|uniref:ABC transporter substrate-binding protein n=1 Tax=Gillisia lutea TaxID=2909668 RepID=A0ABS9EJZ4_9FLAO|nr:ABC transporter substrate-binding protein [Gillisia lutea]MCF4101776.1 ABC transporter substrate-binding protein [Gillisia lutea]